MDKDNFKIATSEESLSKTKEEIVKEAKRLEESSLYSAKGHFVAAEFWQRFHLWIGIPTLILAGIVGTTALGSFGFANIVAGIIALVIAALSSVATFLNPNEKSSTHLKSGNDYDALQSKVRIFWTIECWQEESERVLTGRLKMFAEHRDRLNSGSQQIPSWAYRRAKKGIAEGEAAYSADQVRDGSSER